MEVIFSVWFVCLYARRDDGEKGETGQRSCDSILLNLNHRADTGVTSFKLFQFLISFWQLAAIAPLTSHHIITCSNNLLLQNSLLLSQAMHHMEKTSGGTNVVQAAQIE